MRPSAVRATPGLGLGQRNGHAGDFMLGQPAALRHPLHPVAVAVTGSEVHVGVHPGGVAEQGLLDHAVALDELPPIGRTEQPQAGDAVADRDLVGGLGVPVGADELFDRQSLFRHPLLEPAGGEAEIRALPLHVPGEFRQKRSG